MFFAVAVVALTGCSKDEEMTVAPVEAETKTISEIVVGLEPGTRVYMGANYKVYWDEGDVITVWNDKNERVNFTFYEYVNDNKTQARFRAQDLKDLSGSRFYAVYPALSADLKIEGNQKLINTTLAKEQLYRADVEENVATYSHDVAPIAAQTETFNEMGHAVFKFYNLCSLIEVKLKGAENIVVNGISLEATVSAITSASLCGSVTIKFPSDVTAAPTLTSTSLDQNILSLTGLTSDENPNGIVMSSDYKTFYFVVPSNVAVTKLKFTIKGYSISDYSAITISKSRTFGEPQSFEAGKLNQIGANFTVAVAKKFKVGDIYDVDGLKGVVFSIDNPDENASGLHGKIVALEDCAPAVWTTRSTLSTTIAGSADNGETNMESVIAAGITEFPAFEVCRKLTPKDTWYLPASGEMTVLMTAWPQLSAIAGSALSGFNEDYYWCSNQAGTKFRPRYYDSDSDTYATASNFNSVARGVRAIAKF